MPTLYGSLVGTPKQAARKVPVPHGLDRATDHVIVRDTIELAAAAAATNIQAAVLGWESILDPYQSDFSFDDMGAGAVTLSLGDVTYPNALCNATDVNAAAGTAKALKSVDVA